MEKTIEYWDKKLNDDPNTVIAVNELIQTAKALTEMAMERVKGYMKIECQVCKLKFKACGTGTIGIATRKQVKNTYIFGILLDMCEDCFEEYGEHR